MMFWGPGFGWGGMWFGGLIMLVFWGVLIALAILALRAFMHSDGWHLRNVNRPMEPREDNALTVLKERYAKGEIDKEQYERMRADLLA